MVTGSRFATASTTRGRSSPRLGRCRCVSRGSTTTASPPRSAIGDRVGATLEKGVLAERPDTSASERVA